MTAQAAVDKSCANTTRKECGTIDDMIAHHGGNILLQGPEVLPLPKGGFTYGGIITVLGERGRTRLTLLHTSSSGLTRRIDVLE